jgi:transcriptional regulator with XRE-family HTH domain
VTATSDGGRETQIETSWVHEYLRGATQQEIADRLGFSKQHVANLLKKQGIPSRSVAETAALRDRLWSDQHGALLRESFLRSRDVGAVAAEFGLPAARARRLLRATVPDWEVLAAVPKQAAKRYTREELLASLAQAAAGAAGILTAEKYREYVGEHPDLPDDRRTPGGQAVLLRFGSWGAALQAAGLPANPPAGPGKRFDDPGAAVAALVECWRELGRPPTVADYDLWQREKPGHPSTATSRRLLGTWSSAQVRAWQIVHGIRLDQDDPAVAVPESAAGASGAGATQPDPAPYLRVDEQVAVAAALEISLDGYLKLERAVRAHARLQNAVADAFLAAGVDPRSPLPDEPGFDVACFTPGGALIVVEVKSCTPGNLELQLRLGLGQVLRYAQQLRVRYPAVRAALAVEMSPPDGWAELLEGLGVALIAQDALEADIARLLAGS